MKKVVFIDRDGTLNIDEDYVYKKEDFKFIPGAEKAVRILNELGFVVVVVTNQAGVGRGYYTEADVKALHAYVNECLKKAGAHIDAFYYCPHHPVYGIGDYLKTCGCRKPAVGMLDAADTVYSVDREHSYMIGDNIGDIRAGRSFGLTSILVGTGHGSQVKDELAGEYDYYAADLAKAVQWIAEGLPKQTKGGVYHDR